MAPTDAPNPYSHGLKYCLDKQAITYAYRRINQLQIEGDS